ncbi:MAG TPA: hypothetical protein VIF60_00385 [Burkholderiaceae bacterium]|jgi:hypothetical protein
MAVRTAFNESFSLRWSNRPAWPTNRQAAPGYIAWGHSGGKEKAVGMIGVEQRSIKINEGDIFKVISGMSAQRLRLEPHEAFRGGWAAMCVLIFSILCTSLGSIKSSVP